MSILIKGMAMPKNCWECPCFREDHVCNLDNECREVYDGRPDWCPLVEVKTPHGRLIDADKTIDNLAKAIPWIIDDAKSNAYVEGLNRARIEIDDSETVIEVEGEP